MAMTTDLLGFGLDEDEKELSRRLSSSSLHSVVFVFVFVFVFPITKRRKSFLGGGSNPVTRLSPSFPTAYCVPSKCQQFSTLTMMMIMMFICYVNVKTQKTKLGSATTDGQNFFPSYNVVRQQLSHCIDCFLSQVPKCPSAQAAK